MGTGEGFIPLDVEHEEGLVRIALRPLKERAFRPRSGGIREWRPRSRGYGVVLLTKHISPSIRTTVGWLYPLEHYEESLRLNPVMHYAELPALIGPSGEPDAASVRVVLREARNRLDDEQYEWLAGYLDLLVTPFRGSIDLDFREPSPRVEITPVHPSITVLDSKMGELLAVTGT